MFKPDKGRAFSYFSIVAKNHLILQNNGNYKRYKKTALPIAASHAMFFKYQKKSIFSIPIATTPAAEPMIKHASSCSCRIGYIRAIKGRLVTFANIPMDAATKRNIINNCR